MNNVWTVAFKAPCTGLSTSLVSRCHRPTPIALLAGFAKSITPCRTYNSGPSSTSIEFRGRRTVPPWRLSQIRCYASKLKSPPSTSDAPASADTPNPISSTPSVPNKAYQEGNEETGIDVDEVVPPATVNLSAGQIIAIFGPGTSFDTGMQILQELQMRRVSGSLQDKGLDLPEIEDVTETQALAGLEYLRDNFPVDEEAAAKEWSQFEIERLTHAIEERAERVGLYKKIEAEYEEDADEPQPKQVTNVYGDSVLVQRQKELKAKEAAEEQAKKEAEEKGQPVESYKGRGLVISKEQQIDIRRDQNRKLAEQYSKAAELSTEKILADRSAFSRLWPSTLFAIAVIVASLVFAESYEPPTSSMRVFPYVSPAMATCMGIAVINMVVFILWRNPSIWKSFNRYMLMSVGHPIPFSVFGSMFSHQYPKHLLTNGFILFLAGPTVCEEIGRGNFIALFIIAGIGGNIFSLYYNVLIKNFLSASLGMSSACYGIVAAYFLLDKRRLGTETFGFDYNGWFALIPLLLSELISWRKTPRLVKGDTGGGSDYANHVGGMIAGAILGLWLKWRKEGESRAWEEYDGLPVEIQEVEESASPVSVVKTNVQ